MAAKGNEQAALPAGEDDKKQKKSSRGKRIIILLIVLLTLGAVGGGGYWWLYMRGPAAPETADAPAKTEQAANEANASDGKKDAPQQNAQGGVRIERQSDLPRSGGIVVPLPSITVNLADPAGRRYLKIGMEVELNEDVTAQLQQQAPRVRDAIIMLLAGKSYGDVATPDGKVLHKGEVAARLNQILGAQRVIRVYFTDFVVQ